MDINTIASSAANATARSAADGAGLKLADDFDNFLTLLTTQLQNQDPLEPMDSKEFTDQLVQFTEVEQSRALYDECTFYNAWALYYQSWLHERRDNAKVAIRLFSELLELDSFNPDANRNVNQNVIAQTDTELESGRFPMLLLEEDDFSDFTME